MFVNKDLAAKDFVKYAEKFRALARLTGYTDELLVDKLHEVISRDMRLVLAEKDESGIPTDWKGFLDLLLNINWIVNPEKNRGTILGTGKGSDTSAPMDIDNIEKKGKGKKWSENASVSEKTPRRGSVTFVRRALITPVTAIS